MSSSQLNDTQQYHLPFECMTDIIPCTELDFDLYQQLVNLLIAYQNHEFKIDLTDEFSTAITSMTKFWKLVGSIENHVTLGDIDEDEAKIFVDKMKGEIEKRFM
jgi:hypothetical protein